MALVVGASAASAQDGGWTHWGTGEQSTRYAPFDQIDAGNFGVLVQDVTEDDLIDFTPELRRHALDTLSRYGYGSMFTLPLHPAARTSPAVRRPT